MTYSYNTVGTCAQKIIIDIDENEIIKDVQFLGGCNGNLKAISKLIEGKNAADVADILKGNTCGPRKTSCADQLAQAIYSAAEQI